MRLCVNDIKIWMQPKILKLNADKTEIFLVYPIHRQMLPLLSVTFGSEMILPTEMC